MRRAKRTKLSKRQKRNARFTLANFKADLPEGEQLPELYGHKESEYTGAPPLYKVVANPTTGVVETFKVKKGIPFMKKENLLKDFIEAQTGQAV